MDKRPIIIDGDVARVPLTRGLVATIDAEDAERIGRVNWSAIKDRNTHYARRFSTKNGTKSHVLLHRVIANAAPGQFVDHIDGDGLNCRKSNLRIATRQQNAWNARPRNNASGFKGVRKLRGRFDARITVNGEVLFLGCFDTAEQAAQAYAQASARLHGEFGRTA